MAGLFLICRGSSVVFPVVAVPVPIPTAVHKVPFSPRPQQHARHPHGREVTSRGGFGLPSLQDSDSGASFHVPVGHLY